MSSATAQPDPAPLADPRNAHAEARLTMLREASGITMDVMRVAGRCAIESMQQTPAATESGAPLEDAGVAPQPHVPDGARPGGASAAPPPPSPRHDPVERVVKLARAIRMTVTLEAKLEDALWAYVDGEVVKAETKRAEVEKDAFAPIKSGRKARVRELLIDAIDRETPDPEDRDVLIDALDERLLCDDAYKHIDDLPLRDIVEHLCNDLKLKPDWKRWAGDGWKPGPPFFRPLCSDFSSPSRKPILQDADGPDPWT